MIWNTAELLQLSANAIKLLMFLALTVNQTGYVQVSVPALVDIIGLRRTSINAALAELKNSKIIAIKRPQTRHEPPIYMINPLIAARGKNSMRASKARRFSELAGQTTRVHQHDG